MRSARVPTIDGHFCACVYCLVEDECQIGRQPKPPVVDDCQPYLSAQSACYLGGQPRADQRCQREPFHWRS